MSESGRIHFEEVKNVFGVFEITLIISGILSLAGIIYRHFKKNPGYLLLSGILTVAIPQRSWCTHRLKLGNRCSSYSIRLSSITHIGLRCRDRPVITFCPIPFSCTAL